MATFREINEPIFLVLFGLLSMCHRKPSSGSRVLHQASWFIDGQSIGKHCLLLLFLLGIPLVQMRRLGEPMSWILFNLKIVLLQR